MDKGVITRNVLEIVLDRYIRIDSYKINKLFCDRCEVVVVYHEIDVENEKYTAGTCMGCGVTLCFSCQSIKHCGSCQDTYCKPCFGPGRECTECIKRDLMMDNYDSTLTCSQCKKTDYYAKYDDITLCGGCTAVLCSSCKCPGPCNRSCLDSGR